MPHWKRLINPDYLGAYSLDPGKDMVLTIKSVGRELITGTGGKREECPVCHWQEEQKPMILNVVKHASSPATTSPSSSMPMRMRPSIL